MKYFKTGGFHRKLQLASLWIVVPLLAVAIFLHAYLIGPLQRSYQELNNRQVEGIVSNINQQFSQLEVTSIVSKALPRRFIGNDELSDVDPAVGRIVLLNQ